MSAIQELYSLDLPPDLFGGIQISQMPAFWELKSSRQRVSITCNDGRHKRPLCATLVECAAIVSPFVACDVCIARELKDQNDKRNAEYWEHVCPEKYRKTDTKFAGFPTEIYRRLKEEFVGKGLFLFGPSDMFKTRVGMLMLKRALLEGKRVQVLWPDDIQSLRQGFDSSMDRFAGYDMLLLDDPLLAVSKEPKLIEVLRQLIDIRVRHERPFIVTSQIGHEDELVKAQAYGEAKGADVERIKSLLKRFRQDCEIVSFAQAVPVAGSGDLPF